MENRSAPSSASAPNGKRKVVLLGLATVFIIAGLVYALLNVFVFSQREATEDAYVGGNQVPLSPQVSGTVTEILTDDTQLVRAGQPLVRLDAADADVSLQQAQSALGEAVRQVRGQFAAVDQGAALVSQRRLELARAREDFARRKAALEDRTVSQEEFEHARNTVDVAEAALRLAERQASSSRVLVAGTSIEHHPSVERAKAGLRQAWLSSSRNALPAPVDGYVARRSVQLGQRVAPGAALLMVVPLEDMWVDANFKEGQLAHLRIGQPVTLRADIYGDNVEYHGKLTGLGMGTGSAFSLLPAQNASGNWIKVVQRVPVRIALDREELRKYPLRLGLSMHVTVDTHDRGGEVLAAAPPAQPAYRTAAYAAQLAEADRMIARIIAANLAGSEAPAPAREDRPAGRVSSISPSSLLPSAGLSSVADEVTAAALSGTTAHN